MLFVLILRSTGNGILQAAPTTPGSGCLSVSQLYHILHLCLME